MYSQNQKQKALKLYDGCSSVTQVIRILGYPTRTALYRWIKERDDPPKTRKRNRGVNTADHPRHPCVELKLDVIKRCFENGEDVKTVSEEIGYSRMSIYKWRRDYLQKGTAGLMNSRDIKREKLKEGDSAGSVETEKLKKQLYDLQMEVDILKETIEVLKKDPGIDLRALKNSEKAVMIDALRGIYSLPTLLQKLDLPRSSYYYQKKINTKDKYADIRPRIIDLFNENKGRYGYRRIHALLKKEGTILSEKVVRRIMKEEKLAVRQKTARKYSSYQGEISPEIDNLVERNFHSDNKNELWLTDISEFAIPAGKIYLSPIVDCFDGYLPSWSISVSPDAKLANSMLDKAVSILDESERPIVHSDRGCHYRWPGWIERMKQYGLTRSMSKKGCSPDNSACEGLFGRIKNEFFYFRDWSGVTIEEFIEQLNDYLIWYNEKRIKKSLGYLSPLEYRQSLGLYV